LVLFCVLVAVSLYGMKGPSISLPEHKEIAAPQLNIPYSACKSALAFAGVGIRGGIPIDERCVA